MGVNTSAFVTITIIGYWGNIFRRGTGFSSINIMGIRPVVEKKYIIEVTFQDKEVALIKEMATEGGLTLIELRSVVSVLEEIKQRILNNITKNEVRSVMPKEKH